MSRVGFDIDGVLYPFEDNLARYAHEYGYASRRRQLVPVSTWDFYKEWGWTRGEFDAICVEAVNNGELFWHGDPYPGSIQQVRRVHDAGHDVVFITSRHYGDREGSERATSHWLCDYFEFGFELHLEKDKTVIPVDYFIDDNLDHYAQMLGAGVNVFLCDRPWNQSYPVGMHGTLEEYVDYVLRRESSGEEDMCENCQTPWKCNGPHEPPDFLRNYDIQSTNPHAVKLPAAECWTCERNDVLARFAEELEKVTGDGSKKRQAGEKPPWYRDNGHEGAIFSHLMKWKRGEQIDPDSGAHPLVHAAWRCLAIACSESGNNPDGDR